MSWRERAACHGEDTELWFPTDRYDRRGLDSPDTRASIALGICATCPVATQCLEAAMREETALSGRWGIRGGLTAYQRADLARQQNRCVECGMPFDKTRANRLTCSETCAAIRHARHKREWARRVAESEATA